MFLGNNGGSGKGGENRSKKPPVQKEGGTISGEVNQFGKTKGVPLNREEKRRGMLRGGKWAGLGELERESPHLHHGGHDRKE